MVFHGIPFLRGKLLWARLLWARRRGVACIWRVYAAERIFDLKNARGIDDDAEVNYSPREEAKKEFEAFIEKYFDIPCTLIGYADVGWYDLKEHKWIEK